MNLLVLVGLIVWLVPTIAGLWYLYAFREMRDEIRTIRRYLQALYENQKR
jgi:hypothetical protein